MLFDLDGVILSERCYWDAAALTIAYFADRAGITKQVYADVPDIERIDEYGQVADLRRAFLPDELLYAMRARSINSNWDRAYAGLMLLLATMPVDLQTFAPLALGLLERSTNMGQGLLQELAAMDDMVESMKRLWPGENMLQVVTNRFQQYFLGDPTSLSPIFREGLIQYETSLDAPERVAAVLQGWKEADMVLGIGTGRPRDEALRPLARLQLLSYFDRARIRTIDDVMVEEARLGMQKNSLSKPHPFTYRSASIGYQPQEVCVIGDSPADLYAARAAGFQFIGVGQPESFRNDSSYARAFVPSVLQISL